MIIRRERLHQRLHETKRLTVISAPPGSGKTTLLCEWADEQKALWVSLRESDNTVECFWHTLIAALGENWLDLVRT
ncbi:MAG: hypothetical protein K8I82_19360, partial [Anaerolineae bacterium]|nr:hypothetical protein [Anaerolineae bacterium]